MIHHNKQSNIMYRSWEAPDPSSALLLVHGLGAHSGRWEELAEYLLKNGISSFAIELKGFGETKGIRGHIDSFRAYIRDIRSLRELIREELPGKKAYIVGESLGALCAILTTARDPALFDGLICISPAFVSTMRLSVGQYAALVLSLVFDPKKQFTVPFTSAMCTRDEAYVRKMENDPREHRLASARLLFETVVAQIECGRLAGKASIPALFLLAGNDKLVDPGASRRIFKKLAAKDKVIIEYAAMYHALSIDIGKEKVFSDMWGWIRERL
ncbi:MAG: lysophospholipase [Candidatus Omnitrophota bacterium]